MVERPMTLPMLSCLTEYKLFYRQVALARLAIDYKMEFSNKIKRYLLHIMEEYQFTLFLPTEKRSLRAWGLNLGYDTLKNRQARQLS